MFKHKPLSAKGRPILEPSAPLEAADYESLAREIDPYIAEHGILSGVLVYARTFPGWSNLEAGQLGTT